VLKVYKFQIFLFTPL
jgi:hypothetical protein